MPGSLAALAEALHKANRRSGEMELFTQWVLQEALEAEVQGRLLVGEDKKCGWRRFCLRDVVDTNGTRLGRAAALQVDVFLEPAIQLRRGNAELASKGPLIDQRKKLLRALAGFSRDKNDRRVTKEFQFAADHFFVIEQQLALIQFVEFVPFVGTTLGSALGGVRIARGRLARSFGSQVPFVHDDDDGAAALFGVAGDLCGALRNALLAIDHEQRDVGAL